MTFCSSGAWTFARGWISSVLACFLDEILLNRPAPWDAISEITDYSDHRPVGNVICHSIKILPRS